MLGRVGAQLESRRRARCCASTSPVFSAAGPTSTAFAAFSASAEVLREPAAAGDEDERGRVQRVGEVRRPAARRRPSPRLPASRSTTTRRSVMNGGLWAALSAAATTSSRPSAPLGASLSASPGAARPGTVTSSTASVRSSSPTSSASELLERLAAQHGIVAPVRRTRTRHRVTPCPVAVDARAIASIIRHTLTDAGDVVHAHDPAAVQHPVRDGGERRVAAVVDREAEQLAEEPLVRRRQQQRVAERRERVALAQQHRALRRRLARGRARRRARSARARARRLRRRRARSTQERRDLAEQVVVLRLGIGRRGAQAGCGWRPPTPRARRRSGDSRDRRSR